MKYFRHKIRKDFPYSIITTEFSILSPQEHIDKIMKESWERYYSQGSTFEEICSNPLHKSVERYSILISHEITEEDYNNRCEYSIPLNQYIFE